jgi:hypothetical protein
MSCQPSPLNGGIATILAEAIEFRRLNDHDIGGLQIAVKNAAFVRRVQRVGDLARQPHRFILRHRAAERFPLEILEDQVIGSDVVDLANVWMVDRGDGSRFALKPAYVGREHPLDRYRTIQTFIVRLVDLAHTARADQRLDRVWAESRAWSQEHVVSGDSIARSPSPPGDLRFEHDLSGIRTRRPTPTDQANARSALAGC